MTCPTCNGTQTILYMYDRPGGPPGNQQVPCPDCCTTDATDTSLPISAVADGTIRSQAREIARLTATLDRVRALLPDLETAGMRQPCKHCARKHAAKLREALEEPKP